MNVLLHWCQALGDMPSSVALRESIWVYPIVESIHVLGLCLFVGLAVFQDLRLVGWIMRDVSVSEIFKSVFPWLWMGFAIMVITGVLLFYSDPVKFYGSWYFRVKLMLLAVSGLNAFVFHFTVFKSVGTWEIDCRPPPRAVFAGAASIFLWTAVIVIGRMIAY